MEDFQVLFPRRAVICKEPLNIKRFENVVYRKVNDAELHCDIYLPHERKGNKKLPVVFMVHGEAPSDVIKDMGYYISIGEFIASKGMAAVTFNHRTIISGSIIGDVLDDIAEVRNFISSSSDSFFIDTSKSCVWALSSGMPFGFYNAINYKPEDVKCIVGHYGFGDFQSLLNLFPERNVPGEVIPDILNGIITSPLLIARAGLDFKIIHDSLDRFIQKCLELNADMDLYNHRTGQHAFDIQDDNERSHELLYKTIQFIQKNLLTDN